MQCKLVLLALVVLQVSCLPDVIKHRERMRERHEEVKSCLNEFNISEEMFYRDHSVPDDKKCFFRCLYQKKGLMDNNGQINLDKYRESDPHMTPEILEIHKNCIEQSRQTEICDKAMSIARCVKTRMNELRNRYFQNMEQCRNQFNIPEDVVKSRKEIPEDKKCFYKCVAVKSGKMNENGDFTIFEFEKNHNLAPAWMIRNLKECVLENKATEACEKAKQLAVCMREKHDSFKKGNGNSNMGNMGTIG